MPQNGDNAEFFQNTVPENAADLRAQRDFVDPDTTTPTTTTDTPFTPPPEFTSDVPLPASLQDSAPPKEQPVSSPLPPTQQDPAPSTPSISQADMQRVSEELSLGFDVNVVEVDTEHTKPNPLMNGTANAPEFSQSLLEDIPKCGDKRSASTSLEKNENGEEVQESMKRRRLSQDENNTSDGNEVEANSIPSEGNAAGDEVKMVDDPKPIIANSPEEENVPQPNPQTEVKMVQDTPSRPSFSAEDLPPPPPRGVDSAASSESQIAQEGLFFLTPEEVSVEDVRVGDMQRGGLLWEVETETESNHLPCDADLAKVRRAVDPLEVSMGHIYEAMVYCARFAMSNLALLATVQCDAIGPRLAEEGKRNARFATAYLAFLVGDSCDVLEASPPPFTPSFTKAVLRAVGDNESLKTRFTSLYPACRCCRRDFCRDFVKSIFVDECGAPPRFPGDGNPFMTGVVSLRSETMEERNLHAEGCLNGKGVEG